MAKSALRMKARRLRRQGLSINEIARKTEVAKRLVSYWCRDIELNPEQEKKLWEKAGLKKVKNFKKYCQRRKQRTKDKIEKLTNKGVKEIGKLNERQFFIAGIALYWAEGFKKDHRLGFASSDPDMIKFFLEWLNKCGIKKEEIRLRLGINISYQDKTKQIEKYWSEITKIPLKQFNKPFYQRAVWKKTYENKDDYTGVLRIRVNKSTDFLRKIKGWIKGLKLNVKSG